jgi:hypothetical protein
LIFGIGVGDVGFGFLEFSRSRGCLRGDDAFREGEMGTGARGAPVPEVGL